MASLSEALSLNPPTPAELNLSAQLDALLVAHRQYESDAGMTKCYSALGKIGKIVKAFVREVLTAKHKPESMVATAGGKVFTYGSFRLGVCTPGGDIDTLIVGPQDVTRKDFFAVFGRMMREQPETSSLVAVEEAKVPVLKVVFAGIDLDIIYCPLRMSTVPDSLVLSDDELLRSLSDRDVFTLNGSRVTDKILDLVPNVPAFRATLHAVKYWAKQRGLYGFKLGFLNGVSYAILVARVTQLFPKGPPARLVTWLFRWLVSHEFARSPVRLRLPEPRDMGFPEWSPELPRCQQHVMPIVTPTYPAQNSADSVSRSTFAVLQAEFARGLAIATAVAEGTDTWASLFEPLRFFTLYKMYMQVDALADTAEGLEIWAGYVESRLRWSLMKQLEAHADIKLAHPHIRSYDNALVSADPALRFSRTWFIGLDFSEDLLMRRDKRLQLGGPGGPVDELKTQLDRFDKKSPTMVYQVNAVTSKQVPDFAKKAEKKTAKEYAALVKKLAEPKAEPKVEPKVEPKTEPLAEAAPLKPEAGVGAAAAAAVAAAALAEVAASPAELAPAVALAPAGDSSVAEPEPVHASSADVGAPANANLTAALPGNAMLVELVTPASVAAAAAAAGTKRARDDGDADDEEQGSGDAGGEPELKRPRVE